MQKSPLSHRINSGSKKRLISCRSTRAYLVTMQTATLASRQPRKRWSSIRQLKQRYHHDPEGLTSLGVALAFLSRPRSIFLNSDVTARQKAPLSTTWLTKIEEVCRSTLEDWDPLRYTSFVRRRIFAGWYMCSVSRWRFYAPDAAYWDRERERVGGKVETLPRYNPSACDHQVIRQRQGTVNRVQARAYIVCPGAPMFR